MVQNPEEAAGTFSQYMPHLGFEAIASKEEECIGQDDAKANMQDSRVQKLTRFLPTQSSRRRERSANFPIVASTLTSTFSYLSRLHSIRQELRLSQLFVSHCPAILTAWPRLLDLSSEQLRDVVHARARRRFNRGLKRKPMGLIKKLRKAKQEAKPNEKPDLVKTHLRNMIVVPEMIGSVIGIYSGKEFNQVEIKPEMVGFYLGEFSIS